MSIEFQNDRDYDQAQEQSHPYRWLTTTSEGLTFRSCGVGDLEDMLHAVKTTPAFALTLKRLDLCIAYDTSANSRVVEFAEDWATDHGIEVDVKPTEDEDFESEDGVENDHGVDTGSGEEDSYQPEDYTEKSETGGEEDIAESHEATEPAPETAEEGDTSTRTSNTDDDASFSKTPLLTPNTTVSSPPPPPFDNPILVRIHDIVADFTLTKHTSQIDLKDPINEGLYLDLLQELLGVCENVELIVLPQRWKDKWRWAGSQVVELRARPEEEEGPEYEEGDKYI